MFAQSRGGDSAPSSARWISSEWHRIQPIEPRMHADRDFSQSGKTTSACINGGGALSANRKPDLRRVLQINLYRKFSLRLHRVCRIKLRDDVAGQILSFSVGPPDTVHFRLKNLTRVKIQSDFDGLPGLHILEGPLVKAGQQVAVVIHDE